MGWNRQPSETTDIPSPLSPSRWITSLVLAGLAGGCLFLLHASQRLSILENVNIWLFSCVPLLMLALAFAVRAYRYGGALGHQQFLASEAQAAQSSWLAWTGRHLSVYDSCLLLPEQMSAAALARGMKDLPLHTGVAKRLEMLPSDPFDRLHQSLLLVLEALQPSLEGSGLGDQFKVTILSDLGPQADADVADAWSRVWEKVLGDQAEPTLVQVEALSLDWIEKKINEDNQYLELIVVLQLDGAERYSDALAALLVCLDCSPVPGERPVKARLLRPMPLDVGDLAGEVSGFMQSQVAARSATGVLADVAEWHGASGAILARNRELKGALQVGQQWNQESLCGVPGPFSSWLGMVLGAELAQHRQEPLLVLGKEENAHWITTITREEAA